MSDPYADLPETEPVDPLAARTAQALGHHRVLLITEGSYPFYKGGVSSWCDTLVTGIPEVDFHVLGLVADPHVTAEFTPPPNVRTLTTVPLWGVREQLETKPDVHLREIRKLRRVTSDAVIIEGLIPSLRVVVASILHDGNAAEMAPALHQMHRFFADHDYDTAMRSRPVWDMFQAVVATGLPELAAERGCDLGTLRLGDLTEMMGLLYRWLTPVSLRLPRVDIAHSVSGGLGVLVGVIAKLDQGAPFLLTEHGVYLREQYLYGSRTLSWVKLFTLAFMRRITELGYLFADQISPGSNFNARWAVHNGAPLLRVRTIYNGADPASFTPVSRAPGNDPVVVWVGRITPVKDVMTLLRAASVVHKADRRVRFRLFGTTPPGDEAYYQECLALHRELGLEHCVTFEGYVPSVETAFNDGDIAVISSITEGFPYTVIEAMLCALPVVATAVGGIPEALTDECGIMVMPRKPDAMAAAILRLAQMSGEQRAAMGRAGRDRAADQFSLLQSLSAYRLSYLLLTAKRNRPLRPLRFSVIRSSKQHAARWGKANHPTSAGVKPGVTWIPCEPDLWVDVQAALLEARVGATKGPAGD